MIIYPVLIIAGLLFHTIIFGQQVKSAKPAPTGSWQQLGVTVVDFKADKDVLWITGADNFRQLKFRVFDAPVQMLYMLVVYENGEPDKIDLRLFIPASGESRVIDLRGGSRRIRKVEFWYKSGRPGLRGTAKVVLWGIK